VADAVLSSGEQAIVDDAERKLASIGTRQTFARPAG